MFTPPHVFEQPAPAFDIHNIDTPAYVVDLGLLRKNLEKLALVQREAGVKVLLALKGYATFSTFPLVREYLSGCCASGLNEALLAHHEFGKEVHVYAPAFKPAEMAQIIPIADHISFNSLAQWRKFRPMLDAARAAGLHVPSPGIRVNPEHSEVEVSLYDPCSPGCRLGIRADSLEGEDLSGIEGLHFHALCEQGSDVLERVVGAVEKRFPALIQQVKWVNMGGGHHISRSDYDVERLIRLLRDFKARWGKDHVYLEPGEAVGLNTGYLIAEVQDIVGARRDTVAISKPPTTLSDAQTPTDPFPYRTPSDARSLAHELYRRLQDDARRNDRADAAERLDSKTQPLSTEEQGDLPACSADILPTAILDLSASAHMPDTMEMPYRPHIFGGGMPGEFPHEYKIGGMTCLAGDVLHGFSFPQPLEVGQRLVFADMAHYTMVKTTTFNGVHHPDIAIYDPAAKDYRVVRRFGYEDFKNKLS